MSRWTIERRAEAKRRFEDATELPLLVLALVMVPLLVVPLLANLGPSVDRGFLALDWLIWAAFAFAYLVRLVLSTERLRFIRREWPELLIIAVPFLRPLRIARSARAFRSLRLLRLIGFIGDATKAIRHILVRHQLHYALLVTVAVVFGSAAAVFAVEEGAHSTIDTFADALWWSVTTITTVGYGDTYPLTAAGRGVAVFLMLAGITLFGVITANIAAFFLERDAASSSDEANEKISHKLDQILERLAALEAAAIPPEPNTPSEASIS